MKMCNLIFFLHLNVSIWIKYFFQQDIKPNAFNQPSNLYSLLQLTANLHVFVIFWDHSPSTHFWKREGVESKFPADMPIYMVCPSQLQSFTKFCCAVSEELHWQEIKALMDWLTDWLTDRSKTLYPLQLVARGIITYLGQLEMFSQNKQILPELAQHRLVQLVTNSKKSSVIFNSFISLNNSFHSCYIYQFQWVLQSRVCLGRLYELHVLYINTFRSSSYYSKLFYHFYWL